MFDMISDQNVPPRIMEMLKIFLAASSRGHQAVLILETRKGTMTTKYRSVESLTGMPVPTSSHSSRRRNTPARAGRSRQRLEEFNRKKLDEQKNAEEVENQVAGNTSSPTRKVVLDLPKVVNIEKPEDNIASPIVQLDGTEEETAIEKAIFTVKSEYGEEDILYSLSLVFPENLDNDINPKLVSRVRLRPKSADHDCTVELWMPANQKNRFHWPKMNASNSEVLQDPERIMQ